MLLQPELFKKINYLHKPLAYKWTEAMSERAVARDVEQEKLLSLLCQLNYKAVFGLGAAAGEWIFWRFPHWRSEVSGKNMDVAFQATEAHWYGLINKHYIYTWTNTTLYEDLPKGKDRIERPIWVTHRLQERTRYSYIGTEPSLYGDVTRLLILARYISSEEVLFDAWLTDCLKRATKLFPNQQWPADEELTRENMDSGYDSNNDPFIPREFYFTSNFDYESADLVEMQQILLKQADYKANDLLNPPEDMIAEGFQGIPYQLKVAN